MKKADIVVILLVLILSVSFYILYFQSNTTGEDLIIEVTYRDENKTELIYAVNLEENIDMIVEVITKENKLYLTVSNKTNVLKQVTLAINSNDEIENRVSITYNEIRMDYANCPNKYCYRIKIHHQIGAPIVCTNGVIVKLVSKDWSQFEIPPV